MTRQAWFTISALAILALAGCGAGLQRVEGDVPAGGGAVQENVQALGGCYAGTCDGKDPGAFGCEVDAYTAASSSLRSSTGAVIGTVALRYSPSCRAVWTRTSLNSGVAYLRAEVYRGGSVAQSASLSPVNAQRSPMLGV